MLWSEDVGPEVVDQSFSLDFVDGMRQIFVQDGMGTLLGRRLDVPQQLVPRYLQRGLFLNSQSFVRNDASLDLTMVEVQRLFQHSFRQRSSFMAAASFGKCRQP
jgi:hypothetical protein